jgi:hypothetical protein
MRRRFGRVAGVLALGVLAMTVATVPAAASGNGSTAFSLASPAGATAVAAPSSPGSVSATVLNLETPINDLI